MKNSYFFTILVVLPLALRAQVNPGPRITALGLSGVALQDKWSMQANQAGIAAQKNISISAAYQNEVFNPELNTQSASIVIPVKSNAFGLSFQNYGFTVYNEQRIAFAYARRFGDNLFAAIDFNFHQLKIQQYGSTQTYSVEAGLQYLINERLILGAHIANPSRSSYNEAMNAVIPVSIQFGASYRFTDNVLVNSGLSKTLNSNTDVSTGIEYSIAGWLHARGGVSVNPFRQYAGFGFKFTDFYLDAALSSHYALGYSPQVSLAYEF